MNLSRRDAFRLAGAAAATAALAPTAARAQEQTPKLKGRIRQSVTCWPLRKIPPADLCRQIKEMGMVGLDLVGDRNLWPVLKEHGLVATMVPGAGGIKDGITTPPDIGVRISARISPQPLSSAGSASSHWPAIARASAMPTAWPPACRS